MLELARTNGISLRAQTKTHKTVEGAVLQTGGTRRKVVTSTLTECEMYADAGFEDILYGFPHIPAHQERVWRLRERLDQGALTSGPGRHIGAFLQQYQQKVTSCFLVCL